MLSANIGELEKMADAVAKASEDAEEAMLVLRALRSEMMNDVGFISHSEAASILEELTSAYSLFYKSNDSLKSLKSSTAGISGVYTENEQKNIATLNSMKTAAGNVGKMVKIASTSENYPLMEQSSDRELEDRTEKLTDIKTDDVEPVNISCVTETLHKDYKLKKIKIMEEQED